MRRKKYMAAVMAGLIALAMPIIGNAEEKLNVWIDETEVKVVDQELNLEIKTDGRSTDGLLEITYDSAVLQVVEEDVIWSEDVEMHSVNIVQDGTMKMAYLSEEVIEEGVLAIIKFTTSEESVDANIVTITGDVHDNNGDALNLGKKAMEQEEMQPSGEDKEEKEEEKLPVNKPDDTKTGDSAEPFKYMAGCAIGIVIGIMALRYRKKYRRG